MTASVAVHSEAPVTNVTGLICRECGHTVPLAAAHVCELCFGPLELAYDYDVLRATVTKERISAGPASLWRYKDLLPQFGDMAQNQVDLGTGFSPLRQAPRLADALGLDELWIKDDTRNPSGSFKDRVVTIALTAAKALGIDTIACASTGNLANSVSAHAAAAGMNAYVFIPKDLEASKILGSAVYGANVIAVDGNYDDVNRLAAEVADATGWGFVNINLRAFYAEGSKTIGFEIAEQLGWTLPDHVVVPLASGAMYVKIDRAFRLLRDLGLVDGPQPRMSGAQATGCSPIAEAYERSSFDIRPQRPDTIARSLAIGNPADGYYALKTAQETSGTIAHVDDEAIRDGMRLLATTEGIFAETAGGVTIATLKNLVASGAVRSHERTVAVISGNGYKTAETLTNTLGPTHTVAPSLPDFLALKPVSA
ncbi:MAG: threonine synthase [Nitriliruptoraceae bacterium]